MPKDYLIVVDLQNDFIDGSLGTEEAQATVEGVASKIRAFQGEVFYTLDTHDADYLKTSEGKALPVEHCIRNTQGWELNPTVKAALDERNAQGFIKHTFGSTDLVDTLVDIHEAEGISSIELLGLCTDICVVSNALMIKAHMPEIPLRVDGSLSAGVTPAKHEAALETMRSCQVEVI